MLCVGSIASFASLTQASGLFIPGWSALVDCKAFALATADDALPGKRPARFRDDRALRLAAAVGMEIDDHPILDLVEVHARGRYLRTMR